MGNEWSNVLLKSSQARKESPPTEPDKTTSLPKTFFLLCIEEIKTNFKPSKTKQKTKGKKNQNPQLILRVKKRCFLLLGALNAWPAWCLPTMPLTKQQRGCWYVRGLLWHLMVSCTCEPWWSQQTVSNRSILQIQYKKLRHRSTWKQNVQLAFTFSLMAAAKHDKLLTFYLTKKVTVTYIPVLVHWAISTLFPVSSFSSNITHSLNTGWIYEKLIMSK